MPTHLVRQGRSFLLHENGDTTAGTTYLHLWDEEGHEVPPERWDEALGKETADWLRDESEAESTWADDDA